MPPNISIIALPAKSPELNPVENIWQFMRDNWLSNRVFKSYDDLVDHCCEGWNNLVDQPWRIHVHRITPMGTWVLINGTWYYFLYEGNLGSLRCGWGTCARSRLSITRQTKNVRHQSF